MQDHSARQHEVDDDGDVSLSTQLDQFVTSVSDALDSADGVDDDEVKAVEQIGQELVDRAEEELEEDTGDERQEDTDGARVEWDGESTAGLEIVGSNGVRHPTGKALRSKIGTKEFESLIECIEDVEEDVDELKDGYVADEDEQEDAEQLPGDVEPSSSPLDFFANVDRDRVRRMWKVEGNKANSFRAVSVAKRWKEFASKSSNGDTIAWKREDVKEALVAILGEKPYRETTRRVMDKLEELGGDDVERTERSVSSEQQSYDVLKMDVETAEGLLEQRYLELELLAGTAEKASAGGVTPVVMEGRQGAV